MIDTEGKRYLDGVSSLWVNIHGHRQKKIDQAVRRGAQVICLEELFRSLYFPQTENPKYFRLAETIPGPTTDLLSKTARRLGVVIIAPVFEKRARGVYHNSSAVIDANGKRLGVYRKMHIPDDPHFYEKYYFAPGDNGFRVFKTHFGKIGVLICWDQWFPEAARLCALGGAEIIFYPTAIGWHRREKPSVCREQKESWEVVQRAHAASNQVFVAVANRTGREGGLRFWGSSFVADPSGKILKQASVSREETLIVRCDLSRIDRMRENWPFLRDRRVDAYGPLVKRFID